MGGLGAGGGTVAPPPAQEGGPSAEGTGPRLHGSGGGQGGLQDRVQGQDRRPEVAAQGPRPGFPQHITLTVQRQASHSPVIIGAPLHHQGPDRRPLLAGELPLVHAVTSPRRARLRR